MPDFTSSLPGSIAYALRILPDGGVLVADTESIVRLDSAGKVIQTYDAPGEDTWFSLNLDPDGTSFWAGNFGSGKFYKFNIATGQQLLTVDTGSGGNQLFGICVYKELTAGQQDSDGDGLPDDWERNGIPGVNLPSMGADPNKKDVFVEVDWMQDATHNMKPSPEAIQAIVQAFAHSPVDGGKGINLHVDMGADSIDYVSGKTWGAFGKGHSIPYQDMLGQNTGLVPAVNALLNDGQPRQSDLVFRYAFFINRFNGNLFGCNSGITLHPQVFLVAMGCGETGKLSPTEQAATFMHELGHSLGLQHGGDESVNDKPNYLSVMNYLFSLNGLIIDGHDGSLDYQRFDYSRFDDIPVLDKENLDEQHGLNGGVDIAHYGTKFHYTFPFLCLLSSSQRQFPDIIVQHVNGPIDWNCNNAIDTSPVSADIDGNGTKTRYLHNYDDWAHLQYKGGNIGLNGVVPPLEVTAADLAASHVDPTPQDYLQIPRIDVPRVQVSQTVDPATVGPGGTVQYTITLLNIDASDANGVNVTDLLPTGFSYVAGSTNGATTTDPSINGQSLTWATPLVVPANGGMLTLSFQAIAADTPGTYINNLSGSSTNGVVVPTGNTGSVVVTTPPSDMTPPTTKAVISPTPNASGWNNSDVAVTLDATDNTGGSGVAQTYYTVDNSACTATSLSNCTTYGGSPFTVSGDGTHTVTFFSVDNAGNAEATNTVTVTIDATPPSTTASGTLGTGSSPYTFGAWTNQSVKVTLSATDTVTGSGVAHTYDAVDKAACTTTALTSCATYTGSPLTISTAGVHTLTYFSQDVAGNLEPANTAQVKIDKTAPTCVLSGSGTNAQGQKYIQITVRDSASGLAAQPNGVVVTEDNNATMSLPAFTAGATGALVVTATKIDQSQGSQVALKVTDQAGNVTNCDPVLTTLIRDAHQPTTTTATGILQSEHLLHIYNGNPGLTHLTIKVNGKKMHERDLAPDQQYTIDVAAALKPGSNNTITVIARGKQRGEATIVIADS